MKGNNMNEKSITPIVNQFIIEKIGLMPTIDNIEFDKENNSWIVNLKVEYPRFYIDDKTKDKIFRYLTLKPVGRLEISYKGDVIKFTPKDKIVETIFNMLSTFTRNIENLLVKITANKLVQSQEALHVFEPMKTILQRIYEEGKFFVSEIANLSEHERYKHSKYFPLLQDLNIIRPIKGGFEATDYCKELQFQLRDFNEFKKKVVETVLYEKYGTIREIFNITRFEPFIHVSDSEYQPSVIAEKLLNFSEENLQLIHSDLFGYVDGFKFSKTLRELLNIQILKKTKTGEITGFNGVFNVLMENRSKFNMPLF